MSAAGGAEARGGAGLEAERRALPLTRACSCTAASASSSRSRGEGEGPEGARGVFTPRCASGADERELREPPPLR